jgi:hypothetical protein
MPKNLHGSKRKGHKSSGVKKNRAGKNVGRDGRLVHLSKADKVAMFDHTGPTDYQKAIYFDECERDRRSKANRMARLKRAKELAAKKKNRVDPMKSPLLEKALNTMKDAETLQRLFNAACLQFVPKQHPPFFFIKRTMKLGRKPIQMVT